ncbi:hypothetical protein E2C01_075769 [Portunus trituberculatus]|uniref:Uncharacterized protein n=1 Tax=Portunus trituberculatus TaxID=210409 RepID=A0A5B7IFT4_PORTR|nr:hypothetical protein [Portunus trituberculatus]
MRNKGSRTHRDDGSAVGVSIPGLLMYLQRAFRRQDADEPGHFAAGVLATAVSVAQQRIVVKRLIFQHFNALPSSSLILTCLCYTVQLRYLVLQPHRGNFGCVHCTDAYVNS